MITLEQARCAVLEEVGRSWQTENGQLMINDDAIFENDEVLRDRLRRAGVDR